MSLDPISTQVGGSHYGTKIQPIEFLAVNDVGFMESNVIKYVFRHAGKNGLEDLRKAKQYLEFIAKYTYGESL